MAPPLVITTAQIDEAVAGLEAVLDGTVRTPRRVAAK
jgi:adenosylmethionine-8-amino-7-oxononanoate aminotransferase